MEESEAMTRLEETGRFEILKKIRGSLTNYGFKALCLRTRREVMIKVIRKDVSGWGLNQAGEETAQKLFGKHQNLVAAEESLEIDERKAFVYPWVRGNDLWNEIWRRRKYNFMSHLPRMGYLESLMRGIAILNALQPISEAGYAHGDLTPANIMLSTRRQIRIIDFGLLTEFDHPFLPGEPDATRGTFPYMPLEQLRNQGAANTTDMFAFGQVLSFMLSGRPQFLEINGVNLKEVLLHMMKGEISKRDLRPYMEEETLELIKELLQKDPELRPTLRSARQRLEKALKTALRLTRGRKKWWMR